MDSELSRVVEILNCSGRGIDRTYDGQGRRGLKYDRIKRLGFDGLGLDGVRCALLWYGLLGERVPHFLTLELVTDCTEDGVHVLLASVHDRGHAVPEAERVNDRIAEDHAYFVLARV
jgi:hypothetical protein